MAIDRDALRDIFNNVDEKYDSILEERGLLLLKQYTTKELSYPTAKEMRDLATIKHIWKVGDKYWKLAQTHYGDSEMWWMIAWFNQKPTEAHCKNGDLVLIPFPLEDLYRYFGL
jgi:hypothetical protein